MVIRHPLDKKDKELLTMLYLNSRASFTQIGKKLKLSGSAVERRMRELEKNGIISLLFADVNFAKLGFRAYRLYFKLDVFDKKTESEVVKLLDSYPGTLWRVICEGEYDVLWRIVARDEFEVEDAMSALLQKFGTKIVEKTVVTTTYQTYLAWNKAFESERHPELPMERITKVESVDKTDMKILSVLYQNARATTVEIAGKVGLTPDAVQYRIKRLAERKFILGYTAWFDSRKLGFDYYKILIGFRNITKDLEKEFIEFCIENDNVVYLNKTIGSWDLEVDLIVRNNLELHEFTREIRTMFGHIIGKHTFISIIEDRMLNPLSGRLKPE
ncbi:MAG: Lrp/AsnC family transcriptional regulator [Candidatus Micrarchaeota archaeon]